MNIQGTSASDTYGGEQKEVEDKWDIKDFNPSTLYVGPIKSSFPEDISVEDLEKHFLKYKAYILHVKLNTGSTTRCGFITFACREIAEAVKKEFRCTSIRGCLIQLTQCAITSHLNPVMVTERWKISQQLFRFINNHYNKQIEIFNKNGGAFVYQNGSNSCAIISCAERDLLTQFFGGIHKKYTQKSIQFEPSTWFRANDVVRTKHKCSILAKAESLFGDATNCDIIVQRDKHATLLVGTCEGVAATHMWLLDQLKEDLEVEREKMETLVILYPGLDTELSLKHHVEILGYLKDSTVIIIQGYTKNVQKAYQKFETLIANYVLVKIQFEHSPLMLESARKRINENGYKVYINADLSYGRMRLKVASFNKQQLKAAEAILKGDLTYEVLRIPDETVDVITPEILKGITDSVSDQHQVSVDCINRSSGMLQISGFVNSDIASAYTTLLEKLFGIRDYNTKISSTNHYIEEHWQLDYEENSNQKVIVVLSGEMMYYLHKKAYWLIKEFTSVHAPVKAVSLASSDDMKCTHTYKLEGKVSALRGVIKEIQCLAKTFCCATERLVILTENARLMQKRWNEFKEKSESEDDICIEFTIASYNYCCSSILRKELRSLSIVEFTICGCNAEQITGVRQKLQSRENGLNLPVQKKPLSEDQFGKLQSLIAKEELCLDQKYPSVVIN